MENRRVAGGRVVQRHVLYLGEINSSKAPAWRKSIEVLEDGEPARRFAWTSRCKYRGDLRGPRVGLRGEVESALLMYKC